ncbi:MAG: hypothetical protein KGJ13_09805 [Patescibacteria group bacterium]|nr:hypothetical protein [Patescibacteria group bacterium]
MASAALTQVQQALVDQVNKVIGFTNGFLANDVADALALAHSTGDAGGEAAWTEIQKTLSNILPTSIPAGAGIAYFIQVARNFAINQGPFNAAVGQVFPQLVTAYNLAVSQLYTLTASGAVVPVPVPPVA